MSFRKLGRRDEDDAVEGDLLLVRGGAYSHHEEDDPRQQ
jgi:hypothetical protein